MYLIIGKPDCKYCDEAKKLASSRNIDYAYIDLTESYGEDWRKAFTDLTAVATKRHRTVPIIYQSACESPVVPTTVVTAVNNGDWEFIGGFFEFEEIVTENIDPSSIDKPDF